MKKTIYTIALLLAAASASQAQHTPAVIKESTEEVADFLLLPNNHLIYAKKEANGQFLYTEQRGATAASQRDAVLNAGSVNAVVGMNTAGDELYVYHKMDRNHAVIGVYNWNGTAFQRTGEMSLPSFQNHSYNLGMFLSPGKSELLISGDLRKTKGYDDIYLSSRTGNDWTKPKGVEGNVNTRQEEFAPFVANDTLYFARKEGNQAYVYAAPVDGTYHLTGEATRLSERVNQADAFTFAYRKAGERETWISRPAGAESYRFYVAEPAPVIEEPTPVAAEEKAVMPTGLVFTLQYAFNEVYMTDTERAKLETLLAQIPEGSTISLKGFSDAIGPLKAKQRVSRQRAEFTKEFISRFYSGKQLNISVESAVLEEEGPQARKTEVHVVK